MGAQPGRPQPIRRCVGCRRRYPQAKMVRFVRSPGGWNADPAGERGRQPGRGAYLCSDACGAAASKNKRYPGLAAAAAECGLIKARRMDDTNVTIGNVGDHAP